MPANGGGIAVKQASLMLVGFLLPVSQALAEDIALTAPDRPKCVASG
jgi:hypothetical protein